MCGRYTLINLAHLSNLFPWITEGPADVPARYNIAPSQPVLAVANEQPAQTDFLRFATITTTKPNELMATMHDRMPVMRRPQDQKRWLEGDQSAGELLSPYPASEMEAYPVSTNVNSARNDGPDLIRPVEPQKTTLFD